jgi:hypothetical protein
MRIFRDIVLAILAAVLVTLALEGGLRVTHERFDASLFQPDPERGYSLRPYAEGWIETDGEVYFKINSDGMRDRERPLQRPAGVLRVAIVGSSDVEGYGVPLEQTFEAVLERRLMELFKPRGKQADVLNFGVAGYSGPQEYLTLQNHVWKYDPQIVVVVWNQFLGLKNTRPRSRIMPCGTGSLSQPNRRAP